MSNKITRSHFSTPKLIAGFSAVAVVLVLGIVWLLCSALIESHTSEVRHLHIQQLCGTIMHLDEVLTMSAKMCAATGNMDWKERYDHYELELDRTIQEAEALVPLCGPEPSEDISVVNARLVEMEQEAFRLTAQGMRQEAMALLESDQYKLDKQKYSEATQNRAHAMLKDVRSSLSKQRWESLTTTAGAIVVMCLILGIAFISSKAMRQHLAQLKRTEESLREAHDRLEQRVTERTAELARVNEQLRSEMAQHQQSEERYRSLVETTSDLVWEVDHNGVYTYVSPKVMDLLGYTPEEVVGKTPFDLMPPDEAERVAKLFRGFVERREAFAALENTNLHKAGRPVVLETSAVPVFGQDGDLLGYRGIDRDITERKKAIEALRQSEETARALINAPTESFLLIESDGTIVTLNETAAGRLGGSVQELVGKRVYDFLPPDVAQPRKAHIEEVIRSGEPICFEDIKEGRFFQSCVYPVSSASGQVARVAIYAQDITDHRKAEEVVLKEREHLKRSLEASDRERQLVAYDIHDGLAQHLTGAMMHFQSFSQLQSNNAEKASEAFDNGLGLLDHALAEARRLIGRVRPPILDEMGIVAAVEHLVAGIKSKGGPEIEVNADVKFDRLDFALENTLFRIIQESLANACMHSNCETVGLTLAQHGKDLCVEIQDWGIGFDVERIREGSFGLESIRERARLLGGNAIIDSEPSKGTRVVVRLPLPEEA